MTERYAGGKIYSIRSPQTDKYYIGSTCLELCKRLYSHRKNYEYNVRNKRTYTTSYEIIKYEDHYIELIELYPCTTKAELLKREGELQRLHKDDIVNNNIAGRGRAEYKEEHKEETKTYNKQHYQDIKVYHKEYRETHKDKIKEYQRLYRLAKKTEKSTHTV